MRRRVMPLFALVLAIGAVWVIYHELQHAKRADAALLLTVGGALILSAILMIVATEEWTAQALGFLAVIGALGVLELLQVAVYYDWVGRPSGARIDLIRAALLVGSVLILIGVIRLAWLARLSVGDWFDGND